MLGADVGAQVHAGRVEPAEERLARRVLPLHEVDRRGGGLVVDRLHALLGERAGVLDGLLADLAEARIDRGVVAVGRLALEHAARAELGAVGRVLRIVRQFRLFLGVEVVEVAEELIEPVHGRQRLVAIADMVLAELAGGVAEVLEQAADRGIELAHAHRRAGKADLGEAGADAVLAGEERRAARRARLLAVVVEELDALAADAVDVGGLVAHQAVGIGADVRNADVVAEDDEDVGLARRRRRLLLCACATWTGAPAPSAEAAASVVLPSRILRRSSALLGEFVCLDVLAIHDFLLFRTIQRNPGWLVEVSTASAWPGGGSSRRAPSHEARRMRADRLADRRPACIVGYSHSTKAGGYQG